MPLSLTVVVMHTVCNRRLNSVGWCETEVGVAALRCCVCN